MKSSRLILIVIAAGFLMAAWLRGQEPVPAKPVAPLTPAQQAEAETFFETQVRPLLVARCYDCHAADVQESGFRVDRREHLLRGGESLGAAVTPEQWNQSPLLRVTRREGDIKMPPDERLSDRELDILTKWVRMGTPWPNPDKPLDPSVVKQHKYDQIRNSHWSLQPISDPPQPKVLDAAWPQSSLDYFVLQRLEQAQLAPSPRATRAQLIRRWTYDLTGLPPSYAEVEDYLADTSVQADQKVVDRLLASPQFGQRWARHWLDVARYADTKGYAFGQERRYPYAYTYRDYVIDAWNDDVPYDQFVTEQLAADLLADKRPGALAGLGLLTVGRRFNNRHDDIDDQIDVVTRGFMGLTVSCARCHDHKYDAIPTEDYYSLYGVFASIHEPADLPALGDPTEVAGYEMFATELRKREEALAAYNHQKLAELNQTSRDRLAEYLVAAAAIHPGDQTRVAGQVSLGENELRPRLIQKWREYLVRVAKPQAPFWGLVHDLARLKDAEFEAQVETVFARWAAKPAGLEPGQIHPTLKQLISDPSALRNKADFMAAYARILQAAYQRWLQLEERQRKLEALSPEDRVLVNVFLESGPLAIALKDLGGYLSRADRNKQRELQKKIDSHRVNSPHAPPRAMVVAENPQPHDPRVFIRGNQGRLGEKVPRRFLYVIAGPDRDAYQNSGRLELAQQIVDPDNPLTRRVIVNRIWMHLLGEPLVPTPSDFGARCEEPVQRELLDHLASQLLEQNWSLKQLIRSICLSSTYQQSSNDREEGRQADVENRLFWRANRKRLEFEAYRDSLLAVSGRLDLTHGGKPVELFGQSPTPRRTIYGMIDRQDLPGVLRVFDFASPDQSSPRRPQTSVPQQNLYAMNSELVEQVATDVLNLAGIESATNPDDKIERLYRRILSRDPSSLDKEVAYDFLGLDSAQTPPPAAKSWRAYVHLLLMTNEFTYVD